MSAQSRGGVGVLDYVGIASGFTLAWGKRLPRLASSSACSFCPARNNGPGQRSGHRVRALADGQTYLANNATGTGFAP